MTHSVAHRRLGGAALALAAVAFAGPAVAGSNGFTVFKPPAGIHQSKPAAPYPGCPAYFDEVSAATNKYVCAAMPGPALLAHYLDSANKSNCKYAWWNDGPDIVVSGTAGAPVVRWICRHI